MLVLPGLFPIEQVRMKSYLPGRKIYLAVTSGQHFVRVRIRLLVDCQLTVGKEWGIGVCGIVVSANASCSISVITVEQARQASSSMIRI